VNAECRQGVSDVIADGLHAETELVRDLRGRMALHQQLENLPLAR